MQTILGANGVIANNLARYLPRHTGRVRLVSRNPKKVNAADELRRADLLNRDQTFSAIEGSKVVYLTAGLKYDIKTWRLQWPVIMGNVIEGCKRYQPRLGFFDNLIFYDRVNHCMPEDTPLNPPS